MLTPVFPTGMAVRVRRRKRTVAPENSPPPRNGANYGANHGANRGTIGRLRSDGKPTRISVNWCDAEKPYLDLTVDEATSFFNFAKISYSKPSPQPESKAGFVPQWARHIRLYAAANDAVPWVTISLYDGGVHGLMVGMKQRQGETSVRIKTEREAAEISAAWDAEMQTALSGANPAVPEINMPYGSTYIKHCVLTTSKTRQ